jgi:hypothetical protein
MQAATYTVPTSRTTHWIGYVISALGVLFLIPDAVIKVLRLAPAIEATVQLGYPEHLVLTIGLVELACLVVYMLPRTAVLGAILMAGYLGGAVTTHLRIGSEPFAVFFPVILGLMLWGGLYLRDPQLRALIPLRR